MYNISIVITVYNLENYIKECVDSAIRQSYPPFEILLIDDGSTDNSPQICDEYSKQNPNIRVIHKKNAGVSSARNTGIQNAIGDYIFFIDGDDYIADNTLQSFVDILDKNPQVDLIQGRMSFFIDGSSDSTADPIYIKEEWCEPDSTGQAVFANTIFQSGNIRMGMRGLYRREFLINNSLFFDPWLRHAEEQNWIPRAFAFAHCVKTNPNPVYYHRQSRINSITSTINAQKGCTRINVYKGWEILAEFPYCSSDFSKALKQQIGSRFINTYYGYAQNLPSDEIKKFVMHVKANEHLLKYASTKSGRKLRLYFRLFGINGTTALIRLLKKR